MSSQASSPPWGRGPLPELCKETKPLFYWPTSYAPLEIRLAGVRAALAAGADPNELDRVTLKVGRPLHYAVCELAMIDMNQLKQNLPIVEALLEAGADPRLINRGPMLNSAIKEVEICIKEYRNESELKDFFEKSLKAMKKVAERLDAEEAAEAARKAESERSWLKGDVHNPSFLGFPQIKPTNCFTKEKNVKVTIFVASNRAAVSPKRPKSLELLVPVVAEALGLSESDIVTQLYDANKESSWKDQKRGIQNLDTASGKVFLTYNPDIFKDGSMAAYQVWAGALLKEVDGIVQLQANDAINTPMMSDRWKPSFTSSKKRTLLEYLGWA